MPEPRRALEALARLGLWYDFVDTLIEAAKGGMSRQQILNEVWQECGPHSLFYRAAVELCAEERQGGE